MARTPVGSIKRNGCYVPVLLHPEEPTVVISWHWRRSLSVPDGAASIPLPQQVMTNRFPFTLILNPV